MKTIVEQIASLKETKHALSFELDRVVKSLSIAEPIKTEIVPTSSTPSSVSRRQVYVISIGLLVLVVGLLFKKTLISVFGALIVVVGFMMKPQKRVSISSENGVAKKDYSQDSDAIFRSLKGAHERISGKWDATLKTQVDEIKELVRNTVKDQDKLMTIYDCLSQQSVVSFPIANLFQKLLSASESHNPSAIKEVISQFSYDYNHALDVACEEQVQRYLKIKDLL